MKIKDLNTGDRFYWRGRKYLVFFTLKDTSGPQVYPLGFTVVGWPNTDDYVVMPVNRRVKPIIRAEFN